MRSCVRLRPLSRQDGDAAWSITGKRLSLRRDVLEREGRAEWLANSEYAFDAVFSQEVSTATVYARAAAEVVPWVLKGVNCTVIAYGQTASGKTFTMLGSAAMSAAGHGPVPIATVAGAANERGIISLALDDVLRRADAAHESRRHRLRCSFLEIYNEQCNDLLAPERGSNLRLFEKPDGVLVAGLSEWEVGESGRLEALLRAAERQRHVGSTHSNERSSRSHLLCTLHVDSWAREPEGDPDDDAVAAATAAGGTADAEVLSSTLQLVDLAGSERRVAASEHQGHEGSAINKSLLTLSTIIHRLSEIPSAEVAAAGSSRAATSHLPFRDSKLTRLLQPCLGGPAHALVLASIRPSAACLDESLATLRFAVRARRVFNIPGSSGGPRASATLFSKLSAEIVSLRKQLSDAQQPSALRLSRPSSRASSTQPSPRPGAGLRRTTSWATATSAKPVDPSPAALRPDRSSLPRAPSPPLEVSVGVETAVDEVCDDESGDEPRDASELADVLDALGVPPSVVCTGAATDGLRVLTRAAKLRRSLATHAVHLQGAGSGGDVDGGGASAVPPRRHGGMERGSAPDATAESGAPEATAASDGERISSGGRGVSAAQAAVADTILADALENELVQVLTNSAECVGLLLRELEKTQSRSRAAAAAGGGGRKMPKEVRKQMTMLTDERARTARRSRAALCGQHDLLAVLQMASREL